MAVSRLGKVTLTFAALAVLGCGLCLAPNIVLDYRSVELKNALIISGLAVFWFAAFGLGVVGIIAFIASMTRGRK